MTPRIEALKQYFVLDKAHHAVRVPAPGAEGAPYRDAALPALEGGDLLAVLSTGAYGYAMASNYNSNPIPAVVLVKEGRSGLMVRRQTWEDLLSTSCDPGL